ncbi:hypothetical protein HOY80DRAFT_1113059 [Tuber brumale]|nr:hypothetical protein HOY80DRAFT_1113840 [Tuber brumale]KAG0632778.1 hypothetical protein HOY80DRAFT_1113059 [Tuber brumale]
MSQWKIDVKSRLAVHIRKTCSSPTVEAIGPGDLPCWCSSGFHVSTWGLRSWVKDLLLKGENGNQIWDTGTEATRDHDTGTEDLMARHLRKPACDPGYQDLLVVGGQQMREKQNQHQNTTSKPCRIPVRSFFADIWAVEVDVVCSHAVDAIADAGFSSTLMEGEISPLIRNLEGFRLGPFNALRNNIGSPNWVSLVSGLTNVGHMQTITIFTCHTGVGASMNKAGTERSYKLFSALVRLFMASGGLLR